PARDLDAFLARWEHQLADSKTSALATRVYDAPRGTLADGDRDLIFHLFERLSRHRILCVTRVGAVGSERVNSHMHRRAAARAGVRGTRPMLPGEPVMVLRNDYERRLFNGDQGIVLNIRDGGSRAFLAGVFPRGKELAVFGIDTLRESIELAYATSVHKAQGSEFDAVAVILPEKDLPLLLTREVLYTAVSRAQRSVVVVGSEQMLDLGITRRSERHSGLAEELSAPLLSPLA